MFRRRHDSEIPPLNTSSTADISFMLLIFFLVTSSMDSGKGLHRQLPSPPQEHEQVADINEQDIMTVTLGSDGVLKIGEHVVTIQQLQEEGRQFAAVNPHRRVIALNVSAKTRYDDYFQLQNAIVAAYRPLKCQPRLSDVIIEEGGEEP